MRVTTRLMIATVLALCVSVPTAMGASIGVGTDTGRISVDEKLAAGGTYVMPSFRIGNTGEEDMGYVVSVAKYGEGMPVPASWVTFRPDAMYLKAGGWSTVVTSLEIPANAAPGHYTALLAATPRLPAGMATAKMNIGAGPRLEIEVVASTPLRAALWTGRRWFEDTMPWSAGAAAASVVAFIGLIIWLVIRRRPRQTVVAI